MKNVIFFILKLIGCILEIGIIGISCSYSLWFFLLIIPIGFINMFFSDHSGYEKDDIIKQNKIEKVTLKKIRKEKIKRLNHIYESNNNWLWINRSKKSFIFTR